MSLTTEPIENFANIERLRICAVRSPVLLPFVGEEIKIVKAAQLRLLRDALHAERKIFGVVYVPDVVDAPPVGSIGSVAIIRSVKLAKTGGKIVKIFGIVRFRIREYVDEDCPYPNAAIEYFRDEAEDEDELNALGNEIALLMKRIVDKACALNGKASDLPLIEIPPTPFSFLISDVFDFDTETRLELLNLRSTSERLEFCRRYFLNYEAKRISNAEQREFMRRFTNIYNPHQK